MQTTKKKPSILLLVCGAILAGYLGYLMNGAWHEGIAFNEFMERFNEICAVPFANYINENTGKAVAIALGVYAVAILMYYTSQRNFMPGKEFGTARFENPKRVNKILMDKDENFNRILSQNVKMSLDFRRLKLNGNILICGGSGAGKTFYEVKPNLMQMPHVQTADMLNLDVPALRGGKPIIVESEPDWYVRHVMDDFVVRAERIRNGGVDPSEDNFLKITHEARLLGTDARLLDKDAPNNPDGKLNKVAENVWREYEKGNADGHIGCQLIFSDIGTPGPDKDFTIYDYLKETLIGYGIPEEEIAFIHDAKTDAQRDVLFKEMRTGKKKVLIGSTDKCGTGVNVQTHLVAMHHVDCPWKPSSIEQREGRGIRQGNENEEVAIYRYVTKGTFDAYNWSLVENKQRFISQVMTSKAVSRSCEDIDEATLSYAEIKAVATGNPLIKEKMEIDNEVQRLKLLKASYDNQRYGLQDNFMIRYPKLIATATEKLACVREDVRVRDEELIKNPEFAITIGKATYTERVDGGKMMLEAISKCKTGETTAIGVFHGFELLVEKNFLGINYLVLRGKTEYKAELSTSPVGNMVKLENLFNGLHEHVDFLEKKIEQYQNDLKASKKEYEKPFAYSRELEEKLARQCELNAQLDLENAQAVDADLGGVDEKTQETPRAEYVAEDRGFYETGSAVTKRRER